MIRARFCEGLGFLGIALDDARNPAHAVVISVPTSRVVVRVMRTSEELIIVRLVAACVPLEEGSTWRDATFTVERPIVFAYHGYPWLIHRLTYRRTNHHNLHVRGYKEEGTTTPFDMVVLNDMDRFPLAADVIARVPGLGPHGADAQRACHETLAEHRRHIEQYGEDMPEIRD